MAHSRPYKSWKLTSVLGARSDMRASIPKQAITRKGRHAKTVVIAGARNG